MILKIVRSIITNEPSGERVSLPRDGQGILCANEKHPDKTRLPLQIIWLQGKNLDIYIKKTKFAVEDINNDDKIKNE